MEREGLQNSRVFRLRVWYASSYETCLELSNTVKLDLTLAGVMIQKKSIWELQNYIEWFGFFSDMFGGTLTIPSHKVNKLLDKIIYIVIKYVTLTHFVLARIAGTTSITVSFSKG